jgi:hypothetical protein
MNNEDDDDDTDGEVMRCQSRLSCVDGSGISDDQMTTCAARVMINE